MVLRKQTVWLLTMLAVMVVLSGYYLVKGPEEQMPAVTGEPQQEEPLYGVEVESKESDTPAPDAAPVEGQNGATGTPAADNAEATNQPVAVNDTLSEVFQGYKMKREALIQQQKDEQLAIMGNSEASPQAIAEAKAKFDELSNLETATLNLEEMLKASGYKDAVVYVQNDKVNVIVQKDKLTANEVVNIIAQVKQQLNVPGKNVTVQFKAS